MDTATNIRIQNNCNYQRISLTKLIEMSITMDMLRYTLQIT